MSTTPTAAASIWAAMSALDSDLVLLTGNRDLCSLSNSIKFEFHSSVDAPSSVLMRRTTNKRKSPVAAKAMKQPQNPYMYAISALNSSWCEIRRPGDPSKGGGHMHRSRHGRRYVFGHVGIFAADEGPDAGQAYGDDNYAKCCADIAEALAGYGSRRDAPLGGEKPNAVREMPADGDHGDNVNGQHPRVLQLDLHLVEGRVGIFGKADAGESLAIDMLADVENRNQAGPALRHVHPVAGPGIVNDVRLAAQPDPH